MQKPTLVVPNDGPPSPATVAALEKIPSAARRMALSVSGVYREIKAGRLGPLVKVGERSSAVPAQSVNDWIARRVAAAAVQTSAQGGGHD